MKRPILKPYFEGVDMDRLVEHQINFISHVLGAPASVYTGKALDVAHRGRNITGEAFGEVAAALHKTLVDAGMEAADIETTMAAVAGTRGDIVSA